MKLTEECTDSIVEALDMMDKADKIKCSKCNKEMLSKVTNLGKVKVLESYCSYCPEGGEVEQMKDLALLDAKDLIYVYKWGYLDGYRKEYGSNHHVKIKDDKNIWKVIQKDCKKAFHKRFMTFKHVGKVKK